MGQRKGWGGRGKGLEDAAAKGRKDKNIAEGRQKAGVNGVSRANRLGQRESGCTHSPPYPPPRHPPPPRPTPKKPCTNRPALRHPESAFPALPTAPPAAIPPATPHPTPR